MFKRSLAIWPIGALKPREAEVQLPEQEWVQEEEKLRNQRIEQESPQEKALRLVPHLDFKRLFL
jgi:hypothetical protein